MMMFKISQKWVVQIIGLFLVSLSLFAGGIENKWRIQCSGGANSDGQIVFLITPEDEQGIEVTVDVEDGTGENRVARTIVNAMKAQLPKEDFHVERDDGEDVLIKKRHGKSHHKFAVEIVSNTVDGVRMTLDKE